MRCLLPYCTPLWQFITAIIICDCSPEVRSYRLKQTFFAWGTIRVQSTRSGTKAQFEIITLYVQNILKLADTQCFCGSLWGIGYETRWQNELFPSDFVIGFCPYSCWRLNKGKIQNCLMIATQWIQLVRNFAWSALTWCTWDLPVSLLAQLLRLNELPIWDRIPLSW